MKVFVPSSRATARAGALGWADAMFAAGLRGIERDVVVVRADVHPARAVLLRLIAADAKLGKRRQQKADHAVDVVDGDVGVLETRGHPRDSTSSAPSLPPTIR